MEQQNNPLSTFYAEAPKVAAAFDGLIDALRATTGLDAKTKQLVYIGIKAATGDLTAVHFHVPMARQLGATREEIKDTILLTLTVCGLSGVAGCLSAALKAYDAD